LASKKVEKSRVKRKLRLRGKIHGTEARPRLSVFRSARQIYVQAINDDLGKTIAAASTLSKELEDVATDDRKKIAAAKQVGKLVSERLKDMGIEKVVFDRGRYLYHGRIRALAEAARECGLKF
jgi:large subunit ribosomal protein L18